MATEQDYWNQMYANACDQNEVLSLRGLSVPAMIEAEQMDVLIEAMARLLGNEEVGPRHWSVLRTMSEVNAKNMLNAERAWHERTKAPNAELRGRPLADGPA